MNNEIVDFIYAAFSSSVGSTIYEGLKKLLSVNEFDNLNKEYQNNNLKEFQMYSLQLLENDLLKKDILSLKSKSIFDCAEIKVIGKTSKVNIDIISKEKEVSIGKDIKVETRDGGIVNFKYSDKQ